MDNVLSHGLIRPYARVCHPQVPPAQREASSKMEMDHKVRRVAGQRHESGCALLTRSLAPARSNTLTISADPPNHGTRCSKWPGAATVPSPCALNQNRESPTYTHRLGYRIAFPNAQCAAGKRSQFRSRFPSVSRAVAHKSVYCLQCDRVSAGPTAPSTYALFRICLCGLPSGGEVSALLQGQPTHRAVRRKN